MIETEIRIEIIRPISEAARYAGVTEGWFRVLMAKGLITPTARTERGTALFSQECLDRFRAERQVKNRTK